MAPRGGRARGTASRNSARPPCRPDNRRASDHHRVAIKLWKPCAGSSGNRDARTCDEKASIGSSSAFATENELRPQTGDRPQATEKQDKHGLIQATEDVGEARTSAARRGSRRRVWTAEGVIQAGEKTVQRPHNTAVGCTDCQLP